MLHYLDDFFTAGPADSDECEQNLNFMLTLYRKLNVPIKPSKVEGPATSLTFLGIHLNAISMEASITSERKQLLLQDLLFMHARKKCIKQELLSLIGKLSFACKILPAGRMFLRRLIDLSTTVKQLHRHIRLTTDARLDIRWWFDFLPQWSGKTLIQRTTGHQVQECNYLLMPQELSVGACIGVANGSKGVGPSCSFAWT